MVAEHIGKFAGRVQQAMDEQGVKIQDIATKTEATYEHIRKIVKGHAYPSRHMLKAISEALKLPHAEMVRIANEDRIRSKYGVSVGKQNPEYSQFDPYWEGLTPQDKAELLGLCQMKFKMNRAMKKVASR